MRSMTPAEEAVVGSMLACLPLGERERIRLAGIPRTTYQTVRQRALSQGWILERLVPDLATVRARRVTLSLARPFAEEHALVRTARLEDPATVALWDTPDTVLSLAIETVGREAGGRRPPAAPGPGDRTWTVVVEDEGSGVPALFDFEGAWSLRMLGRSPASYPTGFVAPLPETPEPLGPGETRLLRALLAPAVAHGVLDPMGPIERLRLGRRLRRSLATGALVRRTFLDVASVPPVSGRTIERVVFVSGARSARSDPRALFASLVRERQVAPFLFAFDRRRVLAGTLSPGPRDRTGSVLEVFERHLERIEIVREPVAGFRAVVPFRFDRLVGGGAASSDPSDGPGVRG